MTHTAPPNSLQFPLPKGLLASIFGGVATLSSFCYVAIVYCLHATVVYKMGYTVPLPRVIKRRLINGRARPAM